MLSGEHPVTESVGDSGSVRHRAKRSARWFGLGGGRGIAGFGFTVPILVLFAVFNVLPVIYAFVVSLTNYDLFSVPKFVGINNYIQLLGDQTFWQAAGVTVEYTVAYGPISWILGFMIAIFLKDRIIGRGLFRSVFFIPTILSSVAMAMTWTLLLRLDGPLNAILGVRVPWLTNTTTAILGIAMLGIWQSVGWFMVIFLAGLLSIPESVVEAARVDGASGISMLRYITLPLLRPVFALVVVQTLVAGLKIFSPMYIMTGGGPNNATRSLTMLIYQVGLRDLRMGSAAAISVVALVVVLGLTVIYLRIFRIQEEIGY